MRITRLQKFHCKGEVLTWHRAVPHPFSLMTLFCPSFATHDTLSAGKVSKQTSGRLRCELGKASQKGFTRVMVCALLNRVMFLDRIHPPADMAELLAEVAKLSSRPRYAFMLLSLIAQQSRSDGSAGPYVQSGEGLVAIRDWLSDALAPMGARDPRRSALHLRVRTELMASGQLPADPTEQEQAIAARVKEQVRAVGKCNLSRVVSELVNAGLLKRHYQGYCVDHHNRGAQRQAVYTLSGAARVLLRNQAAAQTASLPAQAEFPFPR